MHETIGLRALAEAVLRRDDTGDDIATRPSQAGNRPARRETAADSGPFGMGRCFTCGAELPLGVEIGRCEACSREPRLGGTAALGSRVSASEGPCWVVSSCSEGDMRLVVGNSPPWPSGVHEAATLVELLDEQFRADRPDSEEVADRLAKALTALRSAGIQAWLTS